jgi:hypothetical protein
MEKVIIDDFAKRINDIAEEELPKGTAIRFCTGTHEFIVKIVEGKLEVIKRESRDLDDSITMHSIASNKIYIS